MKRKFILIALLSVCSWAAHAQTQLIAHRGSWKNVQVPQNSLASLEHAIAHKAFGSEFDVHITQDDVLLVNHDNDHQGIDIATSTYAELKKLKLANGEVIPTAEEYLRAGIKQKGTKLIFELKSSKAGLARTLKAAELAVALVHRLKAQDQVEYIAFSYDACLKIKSLDKAAKVHYLNGDKTPQQLKDAGLDGFDYHVSTLRKNPTWIREAQALNLKTNVWTANSDEDLRYFIAQKIDYITTDEPEALNKLLKK